MAVSDVKIRQAGTQAFLLGNEAIARGAIEAGVDVVACYPGTPSSEISDTLSAVAKDFDLDMEYSANEKVAVEVAFSASMCGARGMAIMKVAGLNVAYDTIVGINLVGVKGGFVVVVCDDPSGHSSMPDQDSRILAQGAWMPTLNPSNSIEAKNMAKQAFEISEKTLCPIMLRPSTRIDHVNCLVELGEVPEKGKKKYSFTDKETGRFITAGGEIGRTCRAQMIERVGKTKALLEGLGYDNIFYEESDIGILTCGVTHQYALEVKDALGIKASIYKMEVSFPILDKKLAGFLKKIKKLIILEEEEPYLELQIKAMVGELKLDLDVYGKQNGFFPPSNEYDVPVVTKGICRAVGMELPFDYETVEKKAMESKGILAPRIMTFCAGCSHRATSYAIMRAFKASKEKNFICLGDIGCYAMSLGPPFKLAASNLAMGSGTGLACGMQYVTDEPVIALVGDSTFFHAGIPPLINAVYNEADFTLVLFDNRATAMTGFQPHPGTGVRGGSKPGKKIIYEDLFKGMGVEDIRVVDPYDVKETTKAIRDSVSFKGVSVVIARQPCVHLLLREKRSAGEIIVPYVVDGEKCNSCFLCTTKFGCPAISIDEDQKAKIDKKTCTGCTVCAQICPTNAIAEEG